MQTSPRTASDIAAALAANAEAVCRHYLPHGQRQGRYWIAGDIYGSRGQSLFVRLRGPGRPGKFVDAATGEHGDLLDIIRDALAYFDVAHEPAAPFDTKAFKPTEKAIFRALGPNQHSDYTDWDEFHAHLAYMERVAAQLELLSL